MLNIISRSIVMGGIGGPQKVVGNLIRGLDILGYPYCINKDLGATSQLWIQDDVTALKEASKRKLKAIVGPNLYVLPRNIPENIDMSNFVYIFPSKQIIDFWKYLGFDRCPQDFWPVGIDTMEFPERKKPKNGIVLIYFKERYAEELDLVKKRLTENQTKYKTIIYRKYNEKNYRGLLEKTKYIIWIGKGESQGIALQEALSMNVPVLVWDVEKIGHWVPPTKKEKDMLNEKELNYKLVTSAYYFDDRCGIKAKNKNEIEDFISDMEKRWESFEPRKYIIENLSLEKQARRLIELFDKHHDISYENGKKEFLITNKKWKNDKLYFKAFMHAKLKTKNFIKSFGK